MSLRKFYRVVSFANNGQVFVSDPIVGELTTGEARDLFVAQFAISPLDATRFELVESLERFELVQRFDQRVVTMAELADATLAAARTAEPPPVVAPVATPPAPPKRRPPVPPVAMPVPPAQGACFKCGAVGDVGTECPTCNALPADAIRDGEDSSAACARAEAEADQLAHHDSAAALPTGVTQDDVADRPPLPPAVTATLSAPAAIEPPPRRFCQHCAVTITLSPDKHGPACPLRIAAQDAVAATNAETARLRAAQDAHNAAQEDTANRLHAEANAETAPDVPTETASDFAAIVPEPPAVRVDVVGDLVTVHTPDGNFWQRYPGPKTAARVGATVQSIVDKAGDLRDETSRMHKGDPA